MTWVAVAVAGGAIVGAGASMYAADQQAGAMESAADKQLQATREGQELLREAYRNNAPYWVPYTNIGKEGTSAISSMLPYLTAQQPTYKPATTADIMAMLPANYEFMKQQGLGATQQTANVGGGGSNVSRASAKFAEDYASSAYQNALQNYMTQQSQGFNQFQTQRSNIYNTLSNIAGMGLQGAAGLSNLSTGTATNIANLGVQGATALASGQVGAANAWGNAINNIGGNVSNLGMAYGLTNGFGRGVGGGQVTGTPYTSASPTGPGTYNVGGSEMVITPAT